MNAIKDKKEKYEPTVLLELFFIGLISIGVFAAWSWWIGPTLMPGWFCENQVTRMAINEAPWRAVDYSSCSGACYRFANAHNLTFECACPWSDNSFCVKEKMEGGRT